MTSSPAHDLVQRQRGDRADRIVAIGAFIAFLATGFVVDDPAPQDAARAAGSARHAPPAPAR
jgi:hypothetical protein